MSDINEKIIHQVFISNYTSNQRNYTLSNFSNQISVKDLKTLILTRLGVNDNIYGHHTLRLVCQAKAIGALNYNDQPIYLYPDIKENCTIQAISRIHSCLECKSEEQA